MLSIGWYIIPVVCVICLYVAWRFYTWESVKHIRFPHESPITHIYHPKKSIHKYDGQKNLFQVTFNATKDATYWLSADEIIKHCKTHYQKVPFIVGCGKVRSAPPIDYGDELLVIIQK